MRIQHNIPAMNAYRNYNNNTSKLSKNLEKLSSGYKINRAGDDAAGLAISEKMRAQITGLSAAQKNVKDGISLVKTAEGAMQEIHDMLNRMDYLATQSANGTYDNEVDRLNLQKEVDALKSEINRIADSANFNGIKLLDGSLDKDFKQIQEEVKNFNGIKLPDAGQVLGVDTVLHKGDVESAGTEFSVNLGNYTFSNREGDTLTVTVGDGADAPKLELEGVADGEQMDSKAIAEALAKKYEADGIEMKDAGGNAQKFTVEVGKTGYDLVFKQVNAPLSEDEVVQAPNSVKIEGVNGPVKPEVPADPAGQGTVGKYTTQITTAFAAGDKVTIAGKEITFDVASTGENSISATDNATAAQQAAAIAKLFENDADWKVSTVTGNADTLQFEQRVASESNVLEAPVVSSSINGTGKLGAFTEKVAFKPASYEFDFGTNAPADGEQLSLGKIAVKFTNTAPNAANEIQLTGNTAADLTSIANYINKNSELAGFTAKADGTKLTVTANKGTTEVPAATSVAKQSDGTAPTVTANADGTWTIGLTASGGNNDFETTDTLSILGVDITFAAAADTGNNKLKKGEAIGTTATDLATILNAEAGKAANRGKNIGNLKFTADAATGTIKVEQVVPSADVGKITQADVQTKGAAAANAPGFATNNAGKASWTVDVETAFANGDKLIIEDADGNKTTIAFKAGTGADINVTTDDTAAKQATAIQAAHGTIGDFTVTDLGNGKLQFEQTTAGTGDIADLKISVEKATTGVMGAVNNTQKPVNPAAGDPADIPDEPGKPLPGGKDFLVDVSTIKQGVAASATRLASTVFTLNDDIIKDGNILKIGDQSFTIKRGADSTTKAAEGTELLDLSKVDEADVLKEAAIMLSNATVGNGVFESNGYDGTSVSFLEKQGTTEDLTTFENIEKQFSYGTITPSKVTKEGKPLTLQIGDTSEGFNQMGVSVGNMHTYAMGTEGGKKISGIDISSQEGAQEAVDVIKNAINYVSSVRGDLGAIQNRLEHTQNNLSVMAENIQDAESTIRDTDVADEMMSYVKNNILVQSAQAMLAQANQLPQGVLQLLG